MGPLRAAVHVQDACVWRHFTIALLYYHTILFNCYTTILLYYIYTVDNPVAAGPLRAAVGVHDARSASLRLHCYITILYY